MINGVDPNSFTITSTTSRFSRFVKRLFIVIGFILFAPAMLFMLFVAIGVGTASVGDTNSEPVALVETVEPVEAEAAQPEPAVTEVVPVEAEPVAVAQPEVNSESTCDELASQGISDIPQSASGYSKSLDRDGDGIACESSDSSTATAPEPAPVVQPEPVAVPEPVQQAPAPVQQPVPAEPAPEPSYANCTAVKAAGAAPIYPGQPGWEDKFDRDHDGMGCED